MKERSIVWKIVASSHPQVNKIQNHFLFVSEKRD